MPLRHHIPCTLGIDIVVSDVNAKAYFATTNSTYGDALGECQSHGTNLAIPKNQQELSFIVDTFKNLGPSWLGINDIETEGEHMFVPVKYKRLCIRMCLLTFQTN